MKERGGKAFLVFVRCCLAILLITGHALAGALEQAVGMSGGSLGYVPPVGNPQCVEGCDNAGSEDDDRRSPSRPAPSGPSPEEREKKRVNAMNYANEKGIKCFRQGDWNCAVKSFEEALQYSPHNPTLVKNLNRAKEEVRKHQMNTSGYEGIRVQAGHGFDTPGNSSGSLPRPAPAYNPLQTYKEPVITPANRTPAIAALENIKTTMKKKRNDTETKMNELQKEPLKNQTEIQTVKKELNDLKNQENFLNFSIEVELKKAPDVKNNSQR